MNVNPTQSGYIFFFCYVEYRTYEEQHLLIAVVAHRREEQGKKRYDRERMFRNDINIYSRGVEALRDFAHEIFIVAYITLLL